MQSEMSRDGVTWPSPWSAPELVMDTEETKNPREIIRSAIHPARMVDGLERNSAISESGKIWQ